MGYILPINNYQYQDYQNRVVQREHSPTGLENVWKVMLDQKVKERRQMREEDRLEYQQLTDLMYTPSTVHKVNKQSKSVPSHVQEKVYSDVTGKGAFFSESI
ncbi:hypothetical protein [Salimicrobium flavidum]|uniref:Uncharacterized protein n=1 Tax=Salimicrobium flavidum TaxID=570947 RepID=A0A1N7JEY6_9BACI|nr:hypothetical protein [Salimicrobium flavidum]SIS47897.1 hypothetical protein SAMN05421687_105170 [Salimicrobium flavidum]